MLRTVEATRYVTPLREGGSLPALVEADDLGLYVLKFTGAGQGPLALVAEIVAGGIGRALGLKVPELVLIEVDAALGRNEPDAEIRALLQASLGWNLGMDFLPGAVMFDPAAGDAPTSELASMAVWFDAFVTNVDRTARNPNLLCWHKSLYFIDHGAALYFHHDWKDPAARAQTRFPAIRDHVLLPTRIASMPWMPPCARGSTMRYSPRCSQTFRTPGCCPLRVRSLPKPSGQAMSITWPRVTAPRHYS